MTLAVALALAKTVNLALRKGSTNTGRGVTLTLTVALAEIVILALRKGWVRTKRVLGLTLSLTTATLTWRFAQWLRHIHDGRFLEMRLNMGLSSGQLNSKFSRVAVEFLP